MRISCDLASILGPVEYGNGLGLVWNNALWDTKS